MFAVTWVAQARDVGWSLLVQRGDPQFLTAPAAMFQAIRFGTVPVGVVLPVAWFVVLLLLAVAAQLTCLDRIALRVGRDETDPPPPALR